MQKTKHRLPLLGRGLHPSRRQDTGSHCWGAGDCIPAERDSGLGDKEDKRNDIMYKKKSRLGNAEQGEGVRRGGWSNLNEGGRTERKSH